MKTTWKWIVTAALLVAVIAGASMLYERLSGEYDGDNLAQTENSQTQENRLFEAPDFTVLDNDGNEVKLSDFRGKPVVINFWATWCYYCRQEMPDFDKAREQYPDVQFLMINATDGVQETMENAKAYIEKEQYGFDVFFDTSLEAVNAYYVTGFPCTYFIDKDGNLVTRASGMLDYGTLEKGIAMITE